MRVRALAAAAVALSVALLAPAPALAGSKGAPDWLETFTGPSPLCASAIHGAPSTNCRATGKVETPYPLGHYQFDWHITTGPTHWQNDVAALIQWLSSLCWTLTLTVLEVVLAALQWAFSLDIVHSALAPLRETLHRVHDDVLGAPWQTVALGVLALGALYHGMVRQDLAESVLGSALAIVMIGVGLYLIQRPTETLGPFSQLANETAGGFLAGAATGDPTHPDQGVAAASASIFDTAVTRPWCAIEFGDVSFCLSPAPGAMTWAQRWLRYAPGTPERDAEYDALAGNPLPGAGFTPFGLLPFLAPTRNTSHDHQVAGVHRQPQRVAFQTEPATVFRATIVIVMCAGLWCCILLIGWLTALLLAQSIFELALVLVTPAVCLAPAFGRRGRGYFVRWLGLLAFTVVGRAVYAFALAIVISVTAVLARVASALPYGIGWALMTGAWLLAFRHRDALFASLTGGRHRGAEVRALLAAPRGAVHGAIGVAGLAQRTTRRTGAALSTPAQGALAWAAGDGQGSARAEGAARSTARRMRKQEAAMAERQVADWRGRLEDHDRAKARREKIDSTLALNAFEQAKLDAELALPGDPARQLELAASRRRLEAERIGLTAERSGLEPRLLDARTAAGLGRRLSWLQSGGDSRDGIPALHDPHVAPAPPIPARRGLPAPRETYAFGAALREWEDAKIADAERRKQAHTPGGWRRPGADIPILPLPPRQAAAHAEIDAMLERERDRRRRATDRARERRAEKRALEQEAKRAREEDSQDPG
ncbi:MAG: hypothetical protein DLM63_05025 [Solirubrobacterales bacterium]|nr:MAG: hypothetical protein DLM63_05025 [Solirubrobacterales bacterium]